VQLADRGANTLVITDTLTIGIVETLKEFVNRISQRVSPFRKEQGYLDSVSALEEFLKEIEEGKRAIRKELDELKADILASPYFAGLGKDEIEVFDFAAKFMITAYGGMKRKSGLPYASHAILVSRILLERVFPLSRSLQVGRNFSRNELMGLIIAGFDHDIIEETIMQPELIRQEFGDWVYAVVILLTKTPRSYFPDPYERELSYAHQLTEGWSDFIAGLASLEPEDIDLRHKVAAQLVKLADRIHNLEDLEHVSAAERRKTIFGTLDIFISVFLERSLLSKELKRLLYSSLVEAVRRWGLTTAAGDTLDEGQVALYVEEQGRPSFTAVAQKVFEEASFAASPLGLSSIMGYLLGNIIHPASLNRIAIQAKLPSFNPTAGYFRNINRRGFGAVELYFEGVVPGKLSAKWEKKGLLEKFIRRANRSDILPLVHANNVKNERGIKHLADAVTFAEKIKSRFVTVHLFRPKEVEFPLEEFIRLMEPVFRLAQDKEINIGIENGTDHNPQEINRVFEILRERGYNNVLFTPDFGHASIKIQNNVVGFLNEVDENIQIGHVHLHGSIMIRDREIHKPILSDTFTERMTEQGIEELIEGRAYKGTFSLEYSPIKKEEIKFLRRIIARYRAAVSSPVTKDDPGSFDVQLMSRFGIHIRTAHFITVAVNRIVRFFDLPKSFKMDIAFKHRPEAKVQLTEDGVLELENALALSELQPPITNNSLRLILEITLVGLDNVSKNMARESIMLIFAKLGEGNNRELSDREIGNLTRSIDSWLPEQLDLIKKKFLGDEGKESKSGASPLQSDLWARTKEILNLSGIIQGYLDELYSFVKAEYDKDSWLIHSYHTFDHSLETAYLSVLISKYKGYPIERILEMGVAGLLHDLDPGRKQGSKPVVANTIEYLSKSRRIGRLLEKLGIDINRILVLIRGTDYPMTPEQEGEIGAYLDSISSLTLRQAIEEQAYSLRAADEAATYVILKPKESEKRVRHLSRELGLAEEEVLSGTTAFFNILQENKYLQEALAILPREFVVHWESAKQHFAQFSSASPLSEKELVVLRELFRLRGDLEKMTGMEDGRLETYFNTNSAILKRTRGLFTIIKSLSGEEDRYRATYNKEILLSIAIWYIFQNCAVPPQEIMDNPQAPQEEAKPEAEEDKVMLLLTEYADKLLEFKKRLRGLPQGKRIMALGEIKEEFASLILKWKYLYNDIEHELHLTRRNSKEIFDSGEKDVIFKRKPSKGAGVIQKLEKWRAEILFPDNLTLKATYTNRGGYKLLRAKYKPLLDEIEMRQADLNNMIFGIMETTSRTKYGKGIPSGTPRKKNKKASSSLTGPEYIKAYFNDLISKLRAKSASPVCMSSTDPAAVKRILLVDDHKGMRSGIMKLLRRGGYIKVEEADNGLAAFARIEKEEGRFDLIISDRQMPELDGWGLLKKVKEHYPQIPFILISLVSGGNLSSIAERAIQNGAAAFISKEDLEESLLSKISKLFGPDGKGASPLATPTGRMFVENIIENLLTGEAPHWMAQDYRAGYLLMKDVPGGDGDSKENKINQAKAHLYMATSDQAAREKVEGLLAILLNHPKAGELSVLQFEGVAHKIIKEFSGNHNAYKAYKEKLDNSFLKIYPGLREEILNTSCFNDRLKLAFIYAGIANLIDPSHKEALKRIADDLNIKIDLSSGEISGEDLSKLIHGVFLRIFDEKLILFEEDADRFIEHFIRDRVRHVIYFLDNHGEIIIDQLLIEQLLRLGYKVTVIGRAETARDDVTMDEARDILGRNVYLKDYLEKGRLNILTCGTYLLGADLTQSHKYPEFQEVWKNASIYIAKGAGNFHTLAGQKLSIPGFHIRMMKGSPNAYEKVSELKGTAISIKSYYDALFLFQDAHKLNPSSEFTDAKSNGSSPLAPKVGDSFPIGSGNGPALVSETSLLGRKLGACVGVVGGEEGAPFPSEIADNPWKYLLRYKYGRP